MTYPIITPPDTPFSAPGRWFKGNLHCHTTESDGLRTPLEVVHSYREAGYDFIAITDHRKIVTMSALQEQGFLVLPGIELDAVDPQFGDYHLLGIGTFPEMDAYYPEVALQDLVDKLGGQTAITLLAHPYWMGLRASDLRSVQGLTAVEVFNMTCNLFNGKGYAETFWDDLLALGVPVLGVASDDTHWKPGADDFGAGWIMVKAEELSHEAILGAIQRGMFWSSTGAEIKDIRFDGKEIYVSCSPAAAVHFKALPYATGASIRADAGEALCEAVFRLTGRETCVRIEVADHHGRRAWSNPFFLEQVGH